VGYFFQDIERRSYNRFPLHYPIHLKLDSGQIIIGRTQNIGSNGLSAEVAKSVERDSFVTFRFSYEKASIGGYGRVVWSESAGKKNLCGITFLKMKQKNRESLNGILERITSPICPVCHSKLDIDKLTPYLERQFLEERINYENASPLMEIAHLLNSNISWAALREKILEVIKNCFKAEAVRLFLYDKKTGTLELSHHIGFQSIEEYSYDFEKSINGEKWCENQIIFIPDVQNDPSFFQKNQNKAAGIRSIVAIPLIAEGKALGILSLYTSLYDQRRTLEKKEKKLLLTFANLIAVGIKMPISDFKMPLAL